jgi:signal transduction histidine kinase
MARTRSRWFGSLYWRIGISFVVFVFAVILAQSMMFTHGLARRSLRNPDRSPNNVAAAIAAEIGGALTARRSFDLDDFIAARYTRERWSFFIVLSDGRVAGNSSRLLPEEIRRSAEAVLSGTNPFLTAHRPALPGPVITAPIQVAGQLKGLVVVPPPPPQGVLQDVARFLSLPSTLLLLGATVLAANVIFGPARRKLAALEQAAAELGGGNFDARAPEDGSDEIARVARAFNRMGRELTIREEALKSSDRLRRQMLADVSHELRTPLTALRGYIETLQMPELRTDPERRARYFETVGRETRRLERVVSDLLVLARHENGVDSLAPRIFAIARLFEHVARLHELEAMSRGIAIRIEVDEKADQILADADRLQQVIENLVANAMRHSPIGGVIELRATAGAQAVTLSVANAGDAIPAEHLPHVFDRFYKADPSRAVSPNGSGLGLSIVKAIVERHGGSVRALSHQLSAVSS